MLVERNTGLTGQCADEGQGGVVKAQPSALCPRVL